WRQAITRFEPAIGDLGGHGIRESQIFTPCHYCTESNVLLAPRNVPDHFDPIKPEIVLRRVQAIRQQCAAAGTSVGANGTALPSRPTGEEICRRCPKPNPGLPFPSIPADFSAGSGSGFIHSPCIWTVARR